VLGKLSKLFRKQSKGTASYRCGYMAIISGRLVPSEDYIYTQVSMPSTTNSEVMAQVGGEDRPYTAYTRKIISGGQTGVDRAALDVAMELGIPTGGWCPAGRRAADGVVPPQYNVTELPAGGYHKRTKWNVRDSDATLIISPRPLTGGTRLTAEIAEKLGKPYFIVDIDHPNLEGFADWLSSNAIYTLNVAGPREESVPGIHARSVEVLRSLLVSAMESAG